MRDYTDPDSSDFPETFFPEPKMTEPSGERLPWPQWLNKNVEKQTRYMKFAEVAASFSKDPSTKVGAVAIDDDFRVLATGYNGFPRGVDDSEERLCNRNLKYALTVHAEANIVAQSAYSGTSIRGSTVLVTSLFPCVDCAKLLVQSGVKRIIAPKISNERWKESNELAKLIFDEAGVEVIEVGL